MFREGALQGLDRKAEDLVLMEPAYPLLLPNHLPEVTAVVLVVMSTGMVATAEAAVAVMVVVVVAVVVPVVPAAAAVAVGQVCSLKLLNESGLSCNCMF